MEVPAPGDVFEGQYEIGEVLGEGGFARVFRARDIRVGRDIALKVISPREAGYPERMVQRFHREAKVVATLQNPHTITMFAYGESSSGLLWMAFEYVAGRDLKLVLSQDGPLPAPAVAHILRQVLESLREAHVGGVLHRDIKPQNVLIYEYGADPFAAKVLDFGIAKPLDAHTQITQTGGIVGTPRYMSPEQIFADEPVPASDIYSLGLVAMEMLKGTPAIDGANKQEMMVQHVKGPPLVVPPDLAPPELRSIIERMVARSLAERYATAGEVLNDLRNHWRVITGRQSLTQPQVSTSSPGDEVTSRNGVLAVGVLTIGIVVTLIVAALWPSPTPKKPSTEKIVAALAREEPPTTVHETPGVPPVAALDAAVADSADTKTVSGCGQPLEWESQRRIAFQAELTERSWVLYVPRGYDHNVPHAVILMLHGVGLRGHDAMHASHLRYAVNNTNTIIIAPDALTRTDPWTSEDDIDLVFGAVERASELACVDRSRLMAVGHGPGARFVRQLACKMRFSAIATMGDAIGRDEVTCHPKPPVPMLRLFGKTDHVVPIDGGRGCNGEFYLSDKENDTFWIRSNECKLGPRKWARSANGDCQLYDCAASYVSCALDGGHDWPHRKWGVHQVTGCYEPPAKFNMAGAIVKFFKDHGTTIPD